MKGKSKLDKDSLNKGIFFKDLLNQDKSFALAELDEIRPIIL